MVLMHLIKYLESQARVCRGFKGAGALAVCAHQIESVCERYREGEKERGLGEYRYHLCGCIALSLGDSRLVNPSHDITTFMSTVLKKSYPLWAQSLHSKILDQPCEWPTGLFPSVYIRYSRVADNPGYSDKQSKCGFSGNDCILYPAPEMGAIINVGPVLTMLFSGR